MNPITRRSTRKLRVGIVGFQWERYCWVKPKGDQGLEKRSRLPPHTFTQNLPFLLLHVLSVCSPSKHFWGFNVWESRAAQPAVVSSLFLWYLWHLVNSHAIHGVIWQGCESKLLSFLTILVERISVTDCRWLRNEQKRILTHWTSCLIKMSNKYTDMRK